MIAIILIALAAGAASALMFASIISGALVSMLLFYLAPLPLMVAALGWGPLCATIGGIAAAIGARRDFRLLPTASALPSPIALPAWWLGHLALLGRPAERRLAEQRRRTGSVPDSNGIRLGRILLWISAFAVLTTMAALLTFGTDAATITECDAAWLMQLTGLGLARRTSRLRPSRLIDALVTIAPVAGRDARHDDA